MTAKKHIGRAEREILVHVLHRNYFFKSPLYMAFPRAANPADRAVGPLSPLPCQAWHGYGASIAHHGEVRGCRRACERTPLRGRRRCAAGGRPESTTISEDSQSAIAYYQDFLGQRGDLGPRNMSHRCEVALPQGPRGAGNH
jgi:hypothetical protein